MGGVIYVTSLFNLVYRGKILCVNYMNKWNKYIILF